MADNFKDAIRVQSFRNELKELLTKYQAEISAEETDLGTEGVSIDVVLSVDNKEVSRHRDSIYWNDKI